MVIRTMKCLCAELVREVRVGSPPPLVLIPAVLLNFLFFAASDALGSMLLDMTTSSDRNDYGLPSTSRIWQAVVLIGLVNVLLFKTGPKLMENSRFGWWYSSLLDAFEGPMILFADTMLAFCGPWHPHWAGIRDTACFVSSWPLFARLRPKRVAADCYMCCVCNNLPILPQVESRDIAVRDLTPQVLSDCQICATLSAVVRTLEVLPSTQGMEHGSLRIHLRSNVIEMLSSDGRKLAQDISLYSSDPHHAKIVSLPVAPLHDTQSELTFERIKAWTETCVTCHSHCPSTPASRLPDRVLDIGTDGSQIVRLYESQNELAKYVCLSHSWGRGELVKTTRDNLSQHTQGIPWDCVSRLLKDTIIVCRRLSIRYLWVDTLCIIQDSSADWEEQAAKMADIYDNSFLTVFSTWTTTHDKGLHATVVPPYTYSKLTAADIGHGGTGDVHVLLGSRSVRRHKIIGKFPQVAEPIPHPEPNWLWRASESKRLFCLLERAWVFQERLLSPRILHFGSHELVWECREQMACDCSTSIWAAAEEHINVRRLVGHQIIPKPDLPFLLSPATQLYSTWYLVAHQYSTVMPNLTYESDVFPALSGMAKRISSIAKDEYVAGLWKGDLVRGLFWISQAVTHKPVTQWRAPSWSWASVNGPVQLHFPGTILPLARLIDVECVPANTESTGELSYAKLTLRSEVVLVTLRSTFYDPRKPIPLCWRHDSEPPHLQLDRDILLDIKPGEEFTCLKLVRRYERRPDSCEDWYLVLRSVEGPGDGQIYQRIGMASRQISLWSWYNLRSWDERAKTHHADVATFTIM